MAMYFLDGTAYHHKACFALAVHFSFLLFVVSDMPTVEHESSSLIYLDDIFITALQVTYPFFIL